MPNSAKTEQRAFFILLGVLVLIVLYLVHPFLNAIVLAVVLAVLFQPLHLKYLKWTRGRANVATFLSITSIILFLIVPVVAVFALVTTQLGAMLLPDGTPASEASVSEYLSLVQQKITYWGMRIEQLLGIPVNFKEMIRSGIANLASSLAPYSPKVVAETANFFLHLFIMLLVLTYLLRDGKKISALLMRLIPINDRYERQLSANIRSTIRSVFYGNFFMGLVQAVLATIGFYFLNIQGFLVWGCVTFFMSFLPTIGTGAVLIPMAIALLLHGKVTTAILLLIYGGVVIGSVDNVLRPFLMRTNMHPMLLFLSIFGGLVVLGPIGILLGPMLMALLTATVQIYLKESPSS
jgi:predicted PurR-regulated permease PerM